MNSSDEVWAWVVGQEGWYEISSFGRVRSYKGLGSKPKKLENPKPIKPCKDGRGYLNFTVNENGKYKVRVIHIEMARAFLPNPTNFKLVRHLNDIKTDNYISNLAWGTHRDNRLDGIKNGRHFHEKGKRPAQAKLTYRIVYAIMLSTESNVSLGRQFGVSESTISKVRVGRAWNEVTGIPYKK